MMNTTHRKTSANQPKIFSKAKKSSKKIANEKISYSKAKLAQMTTQELALLVYGMTYKRIHSKRKKC
jgi:hypothetical protein